MADEETFPEGDEEFADDELLPANAEVDPQLDLDALDDDAGAGPFAVGVDPDSLVVTADDDAQGSLGKSWAFDFGSNQFFYVGARGPTPTWGTSTLRYWIEKCLMTARGAHPIYPDQYGLEDFSELIGQQGETVVLDLQDKVLDALTFHPRISSISFGQTYVDSDDGAAYMTFRVILDSDEFVDFDTLQIGPIGG